MAGQFEQTYLYDAFISYRHTEPDMSVAKALHQALERFSVPTAIKRKLGIKKMGKVFRDQEELPTSSDLGRNIESALENSKWLIVVASPRLLDSQWCMREVDYFIELGRRDRILIILAEDEPANSFPPQLRFVVIDGNTVEIEPLAADVRAENFAGMKKKLKQEKLRLLAPMLEVGFDDLKRRARERLLRRLVTVGFAAALFFAVFGSIAYFQASTIAQQNAELTAQKSKVYAGFSAEELARGNTAGASLLALNALPENLNDEITPEARSALYAAAYKKYDGYKPVAQVPGSEIVLAPDGKTFVASDAECTRVYETETLRLIYEHPGATTTVQAFEYGELTGAKVKRAVYNRTGDVVFLPGGTPVRIDVRTGEVLKEGYFTDADELKDFGLSRYESIGYRVSTGDEGELVTVPRRVIDLGSGEILFNAATEHATSKTLFSPDDKYFIVATYAGLFVFDTQSGEQVSDLPCDGVSVTQGYTFFSPDSRFLVLTRENRETIPVAEFEEIKEFYTIQIVEIPSCRIVYENRFPGYLDSNHSTRSLFNYYNNSDSDIPAYLFAEDSSKLLLPVGTEQYGVFDLAREEMLFTTKDSIRFASFSPSGKRILTIDQSGESYKILDSSDGKTLLWLDSATVLQRGFILPNDDAVILAGGGYCGRYELETDSIETADADLTYFADDSGRYIVPSADGKNAKIVDGRSGEVLAELADSAKYTKSAAFAATGDVVVGISDERTESVLSSWDAVSGKRLGIEYPPPEITYISPSDLPAFFLSSDGTCVTVIFHDYGVSTGGFRSFDVRTGEVLSEQKFWLQDFVILTDRELTKVLYVHENIVTVFDARREETLFSLDDYPRGQLALGIWSGQKVAMSDDGRFVAVSHVKKETLEIIDAETGDRLHEIPLGAPVTTAPCFSRGGGRITIGAGKNLICADSATGEILFSVYDESGFKNDFTYSEDDRYLIGPEIRDAETGERLCSVPLTERPLWDIQDESAQSSDTKSKAATGVVIPTGKSHGIYLPSVEEARQELLVQIREYAFTNAEKLKFALG